MAAPVPLDSTVSMRANSGLPATADVTRFGKYRVLSDLACGGMARLVLAAVEGPEGFIKPCVLKKVLPEFLKLPDFNRMFIQEARIAALLNHPNIVQAFDFGEVNGEYFLALEFVEGASLGSVVKELRARGSVAPLPVALHVGISMCEALAYAHAAKGTDGLPLNLVHRDVTPGNVLVSTTGSVKLTDFGIVRSSAADRHSNAQTLKGKVAYIAPEQARCEPLDGRTDLFSLGLVLYEMTTGRRPLQRRTFAEGLLAARSGHVPAPSSFMPNYPAEFERVLMKALAPDPDDRYPNAKAFQAELEAVRAHLSWTSGTDALGALLSSLYPAGFPNSLKVLTESRPSRPEVEELASEEIELVDEERGADAATAAAQALLSSPSRPAATSTHRGAHVAHLPPPSPAAMPMPMPMPPPATNRLRDFAIVLVLGLGASGAFWLLALP